MPMDDRLARLLLEDNILSVQKRDSARIALLEKLATIKSVDLQTLPIPGTTNPPQAVNPGGWDKSVQYNDGGLFGGDANLLWDKTLQVLTVNAAITSLEANGLSISGGDGAATGDSDGGGIALFSGDGGATEGDGGPVNIQAGSAQGGADNNGGSVVISPGIGTGTGIDGIVTVNGDVHFESDNMVWDKTAQTLTMTRNGLNATIEGVADGTSNGLFIYGGDATNTDGNGGIVTLQAGDGVGDGNGGNATLKAGSGISGTISEGGIATISAGDGVNAGGYVEIFGGGADSGPAGEVRIDGGDVLTTGDGGSIILTPGTGAGAGVDGKIYLNGVVETAPYERHIQLTARLAGNPSNQPSQVDFFTVAGLQFGTTGSKYGFTQWEVPADWDGTDIYFEIDWFPDSGAMSGTDAVRWTVEYRSIAPGLPNAGGELINNGTSVTLDNGAGGDTTDLSQYQVLHTRLTLAYNDANQPLTADDHIFFKISRDTGVANDFGGSVTVTAYEVVYNSKGLPTV